MVPSTEMALDHLNQNYPDCQWLFHRAGRHIKGFPQSLTRACSTICGAARCGTLSSPAYREP